MVGQLHNGSFSLRDPREEECWPYIQRLTEEVEALAPRKLLVLGGLGAAWMRQKWEMGQQFYSKDIWETYGKLRKKHGIFGKFGNKLWVLWFCRHFWGVPWRAPKIHW